MKRRPLDWLIEEDILKLKSGLQRAEAVEARVEAAEPEPEPAPIEPVEEAPTIASARRGHGGKRSPAPLIGGLAVVILAAAAAFWWWSGQPAEAPAPIQPVPPAVTAPSAATAAATVTAATMPATDPSDDVTAAAEATTSAPPAAAAAPVPVPAAPAPPKERFWVVAGPFETTEATRGIRTYAPDLELREDIRAVKLTAHLVRSEAATTRGDAQALADQLAAFGLAAELVADGDAFRLQVGPLASPSAAEQATNLLLSLGHPARSSRVQVDGKMVYIEVGPVPSEDEAAALSRTLSDRLSVRTGLKREDVTP